MRVVQHLIARYFGSCHGPRVTQNGDVPFVSLDIDDHIHRCWGGMAAAYAQYTVLVSSWHVNH